MGRIIAIANQKGGVGKTTTAINLAACLAEAGQKILIIDIDPQGNTTSGFGLPKTDIEKTVYEVLLGECNIKDAIVENIIDNLDILPSNVNLAGAEIDLIDVDNREYILKESILEVRDRYDYIILDCPPSLSLIVDNALYASDSVIIPVECGYYSYEALSQMVNKITKIQKDKPLEIEGILLTKLDNRNTLGYEIVDKVKFLFPEKMFNTIITRSSHIQEAPMHGIPVIQFSYNSRGSKEYRLLAKEILNNNKKAKKEVK